MGKVGRICLGRVLLVGGGYEYLRMLVNLGYAGAQTIDEAEIVLFTGGEDVHPSLYNENALATTHSNIQRDRMEMAIYAEALKRKIPMVGICRGGQFLNVMNGGKMWQHVNEHGGTHLAHRAGRSLNTNKQKSFLVTSTHHQMMRPHESGEVLLVANKSTRRDSFAESQECAQKFDDDVEAVWYEETKCLCFQPHPEFGNAPAHCLEYFEELMDTLILPAMLLDDELQQFIVANTGGNK